AAIRGGPAHGDSRPAAAAAGVGRGQPGEPVGVARRPGPAPRRRAHPGHPPPALAPAPRRPPWRLPARRPRRTPPRRATGPRPPRPAPRRARRPAAPRRRLTAPQEAGEILATYRVLS